MEIIPVLDVKGGVVVRGVGGRRENYAPWASPLGGGAEPLATLDALLRLWPFRAAYVADLDAIMGEPTADALLDRLSAARPGVSLWVDAGVADLETARRGFSREGGHVVLGSETQRDPLCARALHGEPRAILSLDFRGDDFLGPPELLHDPGSWPERVIVMTLARVGEPVGPDFSRVADIVAKASGRLVYAAGGVRGAADLERLADIGAAGALVASALHDGRLGAADLARLAARRRPEASRASGPGRRLSWR